MTVAELVEALSKIPPEAVVLMDNGAGLSLVSSLDYQKPTTPGLPEEVILVPSFEE